MKHFQLSDFDSSNYRYYVEKPDTDFSVKKNYAVINQTIKDYEKMRYTVDPVVKQAAGDRADILASWAKYKLDIGGGKQLEAWLGKENLDRIYGEKLCEKIKMMESVKKFNRLKGNTKFENFYLT